MSPYKSHLHHYALGSKSTHNHFYTGSRRPTSPTRSLSPAQPTSPSPSNSRDASPASAAQAREPANSPPAVGKVKEIGSVGGEEEPGRAQEREQDNVREYQAKVRHYPAPSTRRIVEERVPRLWYGGGGIADGVGSRVVNIGCPRFDLTMIMPDWFWDAGRSSGKPIENIDGRGRGREGRQPRGEEGSLRHAHTAHGSIRQDWLSARSADEAEFSDNEYSERFQNHGRYASRDRYVYDDLTSERGINPRFHRRREHRPFPREHIHHIGHCPENLMGQSNPTRQIERYYGPSDPHAWEGPYLPSQRRTAEWQRSRSRQYAEVREFINREERRERICRDEGEYIRLRGEEKAWVKRKGKSKSKAKKRLGIWGRDEVNDVEWRDERITFDNGRVRKERRIRLL